MKPIRIVLVACTGVAVLLLVGEAVLRRVVERELAALDPGEYRVTVGSVRVNLFRHSIALHEVRLVTDIAWRDADTLSDSPLRYVDASIRRVVLRGIRLRGIRRGELRFGSLAIDSPAGSVVSRTVALDTARAPRAPLAAGFLRSVAVGRVSLTGGSLDWQRITADDTLIYTAAGLDLRLDGFRWDTTAASRRRPLYADSLRGGVRALGYTFGGGSFTLALDTVSWNTAAGELTVRRGELRPLLSERDFPRRSRRRSDWIALGLDSVRCHGVDFSALWNERRVAIDSIRIPSGYFSTYKDRGAAVPARLKPMLHTSIQRIGLPVAIDKIRADSLRVEYRELAEHGTAPGTLAFERVCATVYGLTNRVSRPDQYVEVYADARLMGRGELTAVVSLPVDPTNDRFEVRGTLRAMPLAALDPVIGPLARVELKSGRLDRMDFTMAGGSRSARIDMILRYSDLEIALLRGSGGRARERQLLSELVNRAIIRRENPDGGGLRTATATVVRDPYRSAFAYLWKGIAAGALETAETGMAKRLMNR